MTGTRGLIDATIVGVAEANAGCSLALTRRIRPRMAFELTLRATRDSVRDLNAAQASGNESNWGKK